MAVTMIGAPVGAGAGRRGCEAGPHALRASGLRRALSAAGRAVVDRGDVRQGAVRPVSHFNPALKALPEVVAWAAAIHGAVRAVPLADTPMILGGDHSLSLGTLPALAERAAVLGRQLHVLWIDAHPDCHSLETSVSGNLHGAPLAHALGAHGPVSPFPGGEAVLRPENLLMLGVRDIDAAEAGLIAERDIAAHGPDAIRRSGVPAILEPWLARIRASGGLLHVSLDADALDPALAPGVGTPVAGGLTVAEVRQMLGAVEDSGLLGSLELVEVNPFLDRGGRTARTMVELAAAALGRPAAAARRAAR